MPETGIYPNQLYLQIILLFCFSWCTLTVTTESLVFTSGVFLFVICLIDCEIVEEDNE